jgi:hypothetical protein
MVVGGQRHIPSALVPANTQYPLYNKLGVTQGRSGAERKISSPTRFRSRTFQPVASRYTDWAVPTHL